MNDDKQLAPFDSEKRRQEVISIKTMSEDERKQRDLENEYKLYEMESKYDNYIETLIDQISNSENVKAEFGRGAQTKLASSIGKYLIEKEKLKLEREKFEWAKKATQHQTTISMEQMRTGILFDINVNGPTNP